MSASIIVIICVLLLVAVIVCGLLTYRLSQLRSAGSPALFRALPAAADAGWRHGTVHYADGELRFYRLSSLRPGPSQTLVRQRVEITGRRRPEGTEADILDGMVVLQIRYPGTSGQDCDAELAMSAGGATALQSWLESRRNERSQRRRRV